MTSLLALVLLTLAFVVVAPPQTCTLCPNGEEPLNGNVVVSQSNAGPLTCKDYEQEIIDNTIQFCDGNFVYAFRVACGCPGIMAGSCPGICKTGSILSQPEHASPFESIICLVADQILRGTPGDSTCPDFGMSNIQDVCLCKKVKVTHSQNMGSGGKEGNGGAGNQGMGMMSMSAGRQLKFGDLEEHIPHHAAQGLAM